MGLPAARCCPTPQARGAFRFPAEGAISVAGFPQPAAIWRQPRRKSGQGRVAHIKDRPSFISIRLDVT